MIFDPWGRLPREQTTTTNLISALGLGIFWEEWSLGERFLARKGMVEGRGKGKLREKKEVDVHKPNIDLIEHSKDISPGSTERIGPGRDRRINEEVESQVKGGNREPIA
jgi:hypothetical protein